MKTTEVVCLGLMGGFLLACEPPAKPMNPASASGAPALKTTSSPGSSVSVPGTAAPVASVSAEPLSSASAALPAPPPCPPEVSEPADGLAWVSECRILIRQKIVFALEKSTIQPQSYPILDAVGDILLRNPDLRVEIEGHLGDKQRDRYGRILSKDRAQSVMKYLVDKKGVPAAQLSAQGYENIKPIALNDTEEGRAKNRRIEFVISSWGGRIR